MIIFLNKIYILVEHAASDSILLNKIIRLFVGFFHWFLFLQHSILFELFLYKFTFLQDGKLKSFGYTKSISNV